LSGAEKMRVAIDYRPALFSRSGIARSVRELVRALGSLPAGPELRLFAHAWTTPLELGWAGELPPGVRVVRSRIPGKAQPMLARFGIDAMRLSGGADVFHITDYVHPALGRHARIVATIHDLAFTADPRYHGAEQSRVLRRRLEKLLQRKPVLVFPSTATRDACVAQFGTGYRMHVQPFGTDHVLRSEASIDESRERGRELARGLLGTEEPFVLCLGTIEPRKNHDVLLNAHQRLAEQGQPLPLLVVGAPGWETDATQLRLRRAQERYPLRWTGAMEDPRVINLIAAARVLAYPSSLEGFGFPPLEALELGTPCVAGDCAALREQLGPAGRFVRGRDVEELASALAELYTREDLRREHLQAWSARRERFSWESCAAAYSSAYAQAAADA
jgi:glycosyltransferase involved in cell wall biosynthesis